MADYSVDVGLNVNADQYITTMGQAVAVTQQYSDVTNGIGNDVNKVSQGLISLTQKLTGFNQVNNIAVDTAAQYQKAMSGIETKATAAGKSFTALEKTTKQFARNFPGGMQQAVEVMSTLQSTGMKSEKQMASLGQEWIKLGAATGTNAAAMGQDFTQLNRIMGNGLASFSKFGDALVTTTAQIGGSAAGVVAFSKALAPVASSVGMNETAVIGLSSAMSALGEDGYRSASVFQKVLLDMNRAVRDGGPELKAYGDLMGATGEQVKNLFKENPTEMLVRFTEAMQQAGPELSRTMEALGFDSVRDTRALAALSRSGNLREAVGTAQRAYGNGSMERSAEVANKGVADQAIMLKESSQQIVANIGRPMLAIAEGQLGIANAVAGKLNDVLEGDAAQNANKVTGIGSMVMQVVGGVAGFATLVSLAKGAGRMFERSNFAQSFKDMYAAQRGQGAVPAAPSGMIAQAGHMAGDVVGSMLYPAGSPGTLAERIQASSRRMVGAGLDVTARGLQGSYGNIFRWGEGRPPVRTESGIRFREALSDAWATGRAGDVRGGLTDATKGLRSYIGDLGKPGEAMSLRGAVGRTALGATTTALGAVGTVAGTAGRMIGALGLSGPMLGMAAVAGVGTYAAQQQSAADDRRQQMLDTGKDIYQFYNDFAAATGQASKGVIDFAAKSKASADLVMSSNKSFAEALTLTSREMQSTQGSGYTQGMKFTGENLTAQEYALQAQMILGKNASSRDVAQATSDVYKQSGFNKATADEFAKIIGQVYQGGQGATATFDAGQLVKAIEKNSNTVMATTNDVQVQLGAEATTAVRRAATEAGQMYPGVIKSGAVEMGADRATVLMEAKRMYEEGLKNPSMSSGSSQTLTNAIGDLLFNGDLDRMQKGGFGTGAFDQDMFGEGTLTRRAKNESFETMIANTGDKALQQEYQALKASGLSFNKDGSINYAESIQAQKDPLVEAGQKYLASVGNVKGASEGLEKALNGVAKGMFAAQEASAGLHKSFGDLSKSEIEAYGGSQKMLAYRLDSASGSKRQEAVEETLDTVVKQTKGNFSEARYALEMGEATAITGSPESQVYAAALEQMNVRQQLANAGRPQMEILQEQIAQGRVAAQAPRGSGQQVGVNTSTVMAGIGAQAAQTNMFAEQNKAFGALMTSIGQVNRSAGVSAGSVAADTAAKVREAGEDYRQSKRYAKEDYQTAVMRSERDFGRQQRIAKRDFGIQQGYAQEDFDKSKARARMDFDKQMARAEEDYQRGRVRATEDYNKQVFRANRDFNKQMERAQRDFNTAQARATEDFNKGQTRALEDYTRSRTRAIEDFNKSMKRMAEDGAKSMYDPYKRIAAQMVMDAGQLVTNLKDQQKAMEKQVANLAEARQMGLSEDTIKQLGLADANNAQQLSRLVEDMRGNASYTQQLNEASGGKQAAATALFQDKGNATFSRAQEDQATALARMEEDFKTSQSRASEDFSVSQTRSVEDFAKSQSDALVDFSTSMSDAAADFATSMERSAVDYQTSMGRSTQDFGTQMERMDQDFLTSKARSVAQFNQQMKDAVEAHKIQLKDMAFEQNKNLDRMEENFHKSVKRIQEAGARAMASIGAGAAAQIKSMMENFIGMGQNAAGGSAQQIVDDAKKLAGMMGTDLKGLLKIAGDDYAAVVKGALAELKNGEEAAKASLSNFSSAFKGWGSAKEGGVPSQQQAPAGGNSQIPYTPPKVNLLDAMTTNFDDKQFTEKWKTVGQNAMQGLIEGFTGGRDSMFGILGQIISGGIGLVKGLLGIQSPSTVFAEIGKNVVEGLKQGITGAISGVWEFITKPIADLDIMGKVNTAFSTTLDFLTGLGGSITGWIGKAWENIQNPIGKLDIMGKITTAFTTATAWITDLGSKVTTWVGDAWDSLWKKLEDLDIKSKVTGAFDTAKTWITGLVGDGADSVKHWLGKAWDGLWSTLPTVEDMLTKVTEVFTGGKENVASWISGLATWIKGKMPSVDDMISSFGNITKGIKGAFKNLIQMWNGIDISPSIDVQGPQGVGKFHWAGWSIAGHEILPPADFGGIDFPRFKADFPDLIPTMPMPEVFAAEGGIVTKQRVAMLGEGGYPEVVIPLNQRGAEVLAAAMGRYLDNGSARGAMVSGYTTSVVNNYTSQTIDASTQFNGPVTVQAQNPDEMANKLAARQRRQALVQPIRGRA